VSLNVVQSAAEKSFFLSMLAQMLAGRKRTRFREANSLSQAHWRGVFSIGEDQWPALLNRLQLPFAEGNGTGSFGRC
jgi:hypothetical protein